MEAIQNSGIYARESESRDLLRLYYLVSWKRYLKKKNTGELYLAVQYFRKLISLFQKDYFDKLTAISKAIDTALPITRPTTRPTTKGINWNQGYLINNVGKHTRRNWIRFLYYFWTSPSNQKKQWLISTFMFWSLFFLISKCWPYFLVFI